MLLLPGARAQTESPRLIVTRYTIDAELFPSVHMLSAKARIDFVPQADLTALNFDLHSSLRVEKVTDAGGAEVHFRQEGLAFQAAFFNPLPKDKPSFITVTYGGTLATADGSPVENLKLAYVGPEGSYLLYAARWFPVVNYEVNRFAATMRITVPSEETVIASGKARAPDRQGSKVT